MPFVLIYLGLFSTIFNTHVMMKMASASFFLDALIFVVRNALPVPACFWMNADHIGSI
jgi:hypothetical protein